MRRLLCSLLLGSTPLCLHAGPSAPPPPLPSAADESWKFNLSPFLWMQSIDGTVGVRGARVEVNVPFSTLIKNFDMGFNLAFELRRGRWGILVDANYANVSGSASTPFGLAFTKADLRLKQFVGHVAVAYRLTRDPAFEFDLFAGVRINYLDNTLRLQGNPDVFEQLRLRIGIDDRSFSASKGWVDPIVGLRAQFNPTPKVYVRFLGDVGGFGAASHFTAQAAASIGYRLSPNWSAHVGYRAIRTDYNNGNFVYDATGHGPVIGATYSW